MRVITVITVLLLTASAAYAQQPCGQGIPCKPVEWELPQFPRLQSPTPPPVQYGNVVPTETPTSPPPTATWPPMTAVDFATIDTGGIEDAISTASALMDATTVPILVSGTPMAIGDQVEFIGDSAAPFVGYLRTVQTANFIGPFSPVFAVLMAGLVMVLAIKSVAYLLPVFAAIFGIIRKVVQVVLDFIPF